MVWNKILEVVCVGVTLAVLLLSLHSKIRCNSRTNIQRIWEMNITQHLGHFHLHDSTQLVVVETPQRPTKEFLAGARKISDEETVD